jgi:sulfonate transport system permease protein
LLPPPTAVVSALWESALDGSLWANLRISPLRWLIGFVIGAGLGVALGSLVGLSRFSERLLDTSVQMLRTVPFMGFM